MALDSQQVEIIGRQILIANLLAADLEVAVPVRDRGIDLIVYRDRTGEDRFRACPIQLKAASNARFDLDSKYQRFDGLRIVFVWNALKPPNAQLFALTYGEALQILQKMEYDQSPTWRNKEVYAQTRPPKALRDLLMPFEVKDPTKWRERLCL